jgi:valyl-tRNA synthetase
VPGDGTRLEGARDQIGGILASTAGMYGEVRGIDGASLPPGAIQIVVEAATLILPLGRIVDLGREKARLAKEIWRLDGEIAKIAAKLGNPQFLSKAKPEVIEESREREADARNDRDRLRAAYDRLAAI